MFPFTTEISGMWPQKAFSFLYFILYVHNVLIFKRGRILTIMVCSLLSVYSAQ